MKKVKAELPTIKSAGREQAEVVREDDELEEGEFNPSEDEPDKVKSSLV